jgi:FKBP-type peptidyl-prolyl cis-trans isomerase
MALYLLSAIITNQHHHHNSITPDRQQQQQQQEQQDRPNKPTKMPHHPHAETGISDEAVREAHDVIHHAEQEQHEHDAAAKRGLTDQAVDAEREMMNTIERGGQVRSSPSVLWVKRRRKGLR